MEAKIGAMICMYGLPFDYDNNIIIYEFLTRFYIDSSGTISAWYLKMLVRNEFREFIL